jgi:excisionase family DNA binding protein
MREGRKKVLRDAEAELAESLKLLHRVGYVARRLDVAQNTVRGWIHNGHVQAIRLPGGEYRISREELQRIESQRA